MSDIELETLGITSTKTTRYPNRYFYEVGKINIEITKETTVKQIMIKIYEESYLRGVGVGKSQRSDEIKNLIFNG